MNEKKLELYFHIPFCVRKCLYCDFLSAPADMDTQDAYMRALLQETIARAEEYKHYTVDTVFIGGGTPSVVEAVWIQRLLESVFANYKVAEDAEISMEVNPGTVNEDKFRTYRNAGINRLSIGLQSACDEELKLLGRIHTWQEFETTYASARNAGFTNINVDLMSALPGQSEASYIDSLEKVLRLKPAPEHISAYSLIVEEGTPFAAMDKEGKLSLPDEDCERRMYEQTALVLAENGYTRYEISNYAKEGYVCRHNLGYWKRVDYVGFGIGAASLVDNIRFRNGEDIHEYISNPINCRTAQEKLSVAEQMEEFMFLGLRMCDGVGEEDFLNTFGKTMGEVYGEMIATNIAEGLLQYRKGRMGEGRSLSLTKKGIDISNYVMSQFLFD